MCGVTAIIALDPRHDLHERAEQMLALLRHRGPDDVGIVTFGADGAVDGGRPATVALASVRLAIQDRSTAGHQPMTDPSRRYWLTFNGEIYNYVEKRRELEARGEVFRSRGDTEVLLRLLARDGTAALAGLDGMFSIVLFDVHERTVLVVRDRFGIKPLYYWIAPDGALLLASEIKAFTAWPGWQAAINAPRACDYLARGVLDHTGETMFAGVRQVPPGHMLEIDLAADRWSLAPRRWFTLEPGEPIPPASAAGECRRLLAASVRRRLRSDVPVGSCLSGGLDSSAIVALAAEALRDDGGGEGQTTITARSSDPALDEWRFAEATAREAGARALAVEPDADELFDLLDELVWVQDEPFGSPSIYAQYKVFETAAAHGVTVMLDGQGADELLGGYHVFFKVHLLALLRGGRLAAALRALRERRRVHGASPRRELAGALAAALPPALAGRLHPPRAARVVDLRRLDPGWSDPFAAMRGLGRGVTAFSIDQLTAGSLPMLLHWEDRNSMAHSVEARVPFLSEPMVRFGLGLPARAKLDGARTKVVLREAAEGLVPEPVRSRTDKIAFQTADRTWLCRTHRDRTRRALAAALETCGGLLLPAGRAILDEIIEERRPYDLILWRVICFGAWIRRFGVCL